MGKFIDLTGMKFNRLTVVRRRELDMNYRTVKARLVQYGWTAERAFSTPTNTGFKGTNSEVTC